MNKKQLENSIWGFILGDCWGVPYEFKYPKQIEFKEFDEYGTWGQPSGTWSDDTSMMLALIDSYSDGKFDVNKHKKNLWNFYRGWYTIDGLFDIGNGTRASIRSNFTYDTSNELGNGGLLRCWLAGAVKSENFEKLLKLTHSTHPLSLQCFTFFGLLYELYADTSGDDWKTLYPKDEFDKWIKKFNRLSEKSGTAVNCLKIIVDSLYSGYTLKEVIEQGGDTDSNAAMYGALYYLREDFPDEYKKRIRDWEYLEKMINGFLGKLSE